jgi:hypothetical protein
MTTVVIMPGGFHPYHAGHHALYQSARQAFPDADVYVAATNDTSTRPFPFAVKEKLAKLAGVESGRFVQVKSPFRAEEITRQYNPATDQLIFVRSEKDANSQPRPGGVKRDGSPSYLQPYTADQELAPFNQHAYMAYLPTVEFGPGMTSATEIRRAWPTLNDRRKTALVMSLYPRTQNNAQLAATVVKLLDAAIGVETVVEGSVWSSVDQKMKHHSEFPHTHTAAKDIRSSMSGKVIVPKGTRLSELGNNNYLNLDTGVQPFKLHPSSLEKQGVAETVAANHTTADTAGAGAGMTATYQRRENQPIDEDYLEERRSPQA